MRRRVVHVVPSLIALAEGKSAPMDAILAWRGTPELRPDVAAWLDQLASEYSRAQANAIETVLKMRALSAAAKELSAGTSMGLLYDPSRRLFGVGYAVGGPLEFNSHYDLLASECRLASLVAIAKGDVPIERLACDGASAGVLAEWPDAVVVERHHVRISDAAAFHAQLCSNSLPGSCLPGRGGSGRSLTGMRKRAVGNFGIGLQRTGRESDLSI